VEVLGGELVREASEPGDIGEEHGDGLPLALERRRRGEDLLREVGRRVGADLGLLQAEDRVLRRLRNGSMGRRGSSARAGRRWSGGER
jgi:hypothetical protein